MEKHRDTRLRRHFKERYDFRKNLTDWDYQFGGLREFGPFINRRDYKDWRLTGVAFELRLSDNTKPNRTMASYVYGKDRKSKDNIEVRGFWGDILQSPYIPFGIEIWEEPEATKFMKEVNKQQVYSSSEFSMYNVHQYIKKIEDLEDFKYPFERLRQVET